MSEPNQQEEEASSKLLTDAPSENNQEEEVSQEVLAHDKATGIVIFGAFVAGSLVGIIVCAPAFVVVLLGATTAALCFEGGKAGSFARRIGKGMSDVILAIDKKTRQLNGKYKPTDKAKKAVEKAAKRVKNADIKHGFTKKMKPKARSTRKPIDKRTGATRQDPQESVKVVRFADEEGG